MFFVDKCGIRGFMLAILICVAWGPAYADPGKVILGWVEQVRFVTHDRELSAKLDTGARTSSLDAVDIEQFQRDEEEWVAFTLPGREDAEDIRLEREIVRVAHIKDLDGGNEDRYVVLMNFCIAGRVHRTQVSLRDRSGFNYQLLLGRRVLSEFALIDPSETFLSEPVCREQ